MSNPLSIGDLVPNFCLQNQNDEKFCVSRQDAKKRVIYFYPKNNTRKCTEQACSFRDWQDRFIELGYEVIGISSDSVESHKKFKRQHRLNFTLLSDKKSKVRKLFGASRFFGIIPDRKTFIINEKGEIVYVYNALLEGQEHIEKVLNEIQNSTS